MKRYLLLAGLVFGMPACGLLGNECGRNNPATYYDVQGISMYLARQPDGRSLENLAAGASVSSRELRIGVRLEERFYTAASKAGFISAAYACDPVPAGSLGTAERMDSLSITSDYDYAPNFPAGTPLNQLLETNGVRQSLLPTRQLPQEPLRSTELVLRVPPAASGPQKFRIYYRQTNGEVYTAETGTATLVP